MAVPLINEIPFPEYEGNEEQVYKLYLKLWKQIEKEVLRLSELDPSETRTQLLQRQQQSLVRIEMLFNDMGRELTSAVPPIIVDAFFTGVAYSTITAGNMNFPVNHTNFENVLKFAKKDAREVAKPSRQYKVQKMITDTQNDLLMATTNTKDNVKRLIRTTVSSVISSNAPVSQKKENIAQKVKLELQKNLLKEKLKESDVAIVDKIGRRWKLDTYINMVVRTKTSTAYFDGIREQAKAEGMDLAVINTHPLTTDACVNYQGMVISLNGVTKGYPTYEELKASKQIFHPNCRHFARPIPSMDWLPLEAKGINDLAIAKYRKKNP